MATKIPIQVFSKNELDIAYECARALWYGINFKNGKYKTSDAELLDAFATPFYNIWTSPNIVDIFQCPICCCSN